MVVYKITNVKNGKIYVGQTTLNLKERWRIHKFCAENPDKCANTRLSRAMRKHGVDSFKIEILERCGSVNELYDREVYWINTLNCVKMGYNVLHGGYRGKHSNESKSKISKANKGRVFSKEWCENISKAKSGVPGIIGRKMPDHVMEALLKANKGRELSIDHKNKISKKLSEIRGGDKNPFFNKVHSDESKIKMSKKRVGKKPNQKIKETEYPEISKLLNDNVSMKEIAKIYGVSQSTISNIKAKIKLTDQ